MAGARPRLGPTRLAIATFSTAPANLETGKPTLFGVKKALQDQGSRTVSPTLLEDELSLTDRVAVVSGAHGGLGLEGALALAEAGARAVYCVDIHDTPGAEWLAVQRYVSRMRRTDGGERRLEYICGDVSNQEQMWDVGKRIGDREGRMDVCFTAAGITGSSSKALYIPEEQLQNILNVNLKGMLFTAQAAGQQMARFGNGGSIILVSSILGSVSVNSGYTCYEVAKSGVHQLARSLACELAPEGIRVNTFSPGLFKTPMVDGIHKEKPDLGTIIAERNPMGRIGEPHEIRGTVVWLASDASSFCTGSDIVVDGGHRAC